MKNETIKNWKIKQLKIWKMEIFVSKYDFFEPLYWVENVFVESIILLRLSTHNISRIKHSFSLFQDTVKSMVLLVSAAVIISKSLLVLAPFFSIVFYTKKKTQNVLF